MTGTWTLGQPVCDLWITSDVFCCTASILNIVVIALDRYWLITRNVRYTHSTMFPRRTVCVVLLTVAWVLAALIASAPLLGWRAGTENQDPNVCQISQDYAYTIVSTFGAFWFPLSVILIVYAKIFVFARRRATRRAVGKASTAAPAMSTAAPGVSTTNANGRSASAPPISVSVPPPRDNNGECNGDAGAVGRKQTKQTSVHLLQLPSAKFAANGASENSAGSSRQSELSACASTAGEISYTSESRLPDTATRPMASHKCRRAKRMRRSARTLGLIIGGFIVCWMPFFIVATVMPFCLSCDMPPVVASIVLWLGYSNSLLNPAIYAIWDRSFRRAFRRLATCEFRS